MTYIGQFTKQDIKQTKIGLFLEKHLAQRFTAQELAALFINDSLNNIRSTLLCPTATKNGGIDLSEKNIVGNINNVLTILDLPIISSENEWEQMLNEFDSVLEERFDILVSGEEFHFYTKEE